VVSFVARGLGLAAFAALLGACWSPRPDVVQATRAIDAQHTSQEGRELRSRAIILTIDGVRWTEVFHGADSLRANGRTTSARELWPNLYRLAMTRGALLGAPGRGEISATGPDYVSLPGYVEILTGRAPLECEDNSCARVSRPTLLDEAYAAGASAAAFSSWAGIDRAVTIAPGRFTTSCGQDDGRMRRDAETARLALQYLARVQPHVMFLGLDEPDAYAHKNDYEGYLGAIRRADAIIGLLFTTLDGMGASGANTNVFITADHGRANDFRDHGGNAPESARVWLFAAGPAIAARGKVVSATPRHLADIAPTIRAALSLVSAHGPGAGEPILELLDRDTALLAHRVR